MNSKPIRAILIWRFEDAPDNYKNLSDRPESAQWVAILPSEMQDMELPNWLKNFSEEHWLTGGARVIID
jgi:hypothetical protein